MKYHIIEGRSYPSVTTIINETKPESEKLELLDKARKYDSQNGEGAWDKRRETRSEEGKKVHKTIETWARELLDLKIPSELEECWSAARSLLLSIPEFRVITCEEVVANKTLFYAGQPDLIIQFIETGKLCLLDFKTFEGYTTYNGVFQATWNCWRRSIKGKRCPSEPGWEWCMPKFRDAMLQLCLYKLAWDTGGDRLPIKEAYIIVTCTTGEFQALPLLQRLWDDCMAEAIKRINQFHELMLEF